MAQNEKEAWQVFKSINVNATLDKFKMQKKEFHLEEGWRLLVVENEPEKSIQHLKESDVDPRLLIMLISDLSEDLSSAMQAFTFRNNK